MVAFRRGKNTQNTERDTETHFSLSLCWPGCNRGIVRRRSQVVVQTQTCGGKEEPVHICMWSSRGNERFSSGFSAPAGGIGFRSNLNKSYEPLATSPVREHHRWRLRKFH